MWHEKTYAANMKINDCLASAKLTAEFSLSINSADVRWRTKKPNMAKPSEAEFFYMQTRTLIVFLLTVYWMEWAWGCQRHDVIRNNFLATKISSNCFIFPIAFIFKGVLHLICKLKVKLRGSWVWCRMLWLAALSSSKNKRFWLWTARHENATTEK